MPENASTGYWYEAQISPSDMLQLVKSKFGRLEEEVPNNYI